MNQSHIKIEYFGNNKVKSETEFHLNGNIKLSRSYYETGHLKSEFPYDENGYEHGIVKMWYENGNLYHETHKMGGITHGPVRTWHLNGQLASEKNYNYDTAHGVFRTIDEKGKEKRTYYWNGKQIDYDPKQASLMIDFLENLGYKINPLVQNKKNKLAF